jgi:hypothetical protein
MHGVGEVTQGFSQDYWVQVRGDRTLARDAAAMWLGQPGVDFVLVLDGKVRRGGIPSKRQLLDEFNRTDDERAADCKVYQLQTKAAKQALHKLATR